jgi:outer membrane protein
MKNLSLILNIVLLVAVGVLFYLQFKPKSTSAATGSSINAGELSIAYINSDSVLKHYEYLKTNSKTLEDKKAKMEQDLRSRATSLQNEITAYQRNVNNMTFGQQKAVEEDLAKKQQNFQMYQQTLGQQLDMEQAKLSKELYDRITNYLKKYGAEKGLQVVLKYDAGSDVLFGVPGLDISQDVIAGLNAEYAAEKAGGVKADSTASK